MASVSAVRDDEEEMNTTWTGGNSNGQTPTWIGVYFLNNFQPSIQENNNLIKIANVSKQF